MVALAPTLAYDGHCLGGDDHSLPTDLVAGVDLPVLALASTGSPSWLTRPAAMVGRTAPHGRFETLEGGFHTAPDDVVAASVAAFLAG